MSLPYSATCTECKAPTVDTLAANRQVPIYACGFHGYQHERARADAAPPPDPGNLEALTRDESRDLLDLFDFASLTILRSVG